MCIRDRKEGDTLPLAEEIERLSAEEQNLLKRASSLVAGARVEEIARIDTELMLWQQKIGEIRQATKTIVDAMDKLKMCIRDSYKNEAGKLRAVVAQIEECHAKGQPVLVGTVSIEKSEELSEMLRRKGIKHNVLNAKFHEKEAEIVAQAGKYGAVTVATNMAGRGTDIMLGGNAEYLAKAELRKAGMSDELIAEATGFADTQDQEVLDARKRYTCLLYTSRT